MRWKSMFITIVLNIFVMLAATILFEYINLSDRFISIENTVQEALDSAIESSIGAEELFSSDYQTKLTSWGSTSDSTSTGVRTLIWSDTDKKFYQVNTYLMAYYYSQNGRLPRTSGEVNTCNNYGTSGTFNGQTGFIYEWLYGEQKTDYNSSSLTWANRSTSRKREYSSLSGRSGRSSSAVNSNFMNFYNSVGKYQMTAGYLKEHIAGTSSFQLTAKTYPVLMNMGFSFMGGYTDVSSNITHDNFTSTFHIGKSLVGNSNTYYYLTPASLGVTYVPIEVLKPTFLATLDTVVRLNYIGGASTSGHTGTNIADASNCVETNVYTNDGTTHKTHTASSTSEDIVTDGLVEFDKSTAQVKVDYFYVNFSSTVTPQADREVIISKINGAVQTYSGNTATKDGDAARSTTLSAFIASSNDTLTLVKNFGSSSLSTEYESVRCGRIIARISVKIKVHVPYQSSMMQWMCEKFGTNNHHYDIKLWNPTTNSADVDSDGIWYQYTTYYCTSRS